MKAKYYTHFALTSEAEVDARQEFSRFVEVNQTLKTHFG
jgi:hypothetical protein